MRIFPAELRSDIFFGQAPREFEAAIGKHSPASRIAGRQILVGSFFKRWDFLKVRGNEPHHRVRQCTMLNMFVFLCYMPDVATVCRDIISPTRVWCTYQ